MDAVDLICEVSDSVTVLTPDVGAVLKAFKYSVDVCQIVEGLNLTIVSGEVAVIEELVLNYLECIQCFLVKFKSLGSQLSSRVFIARSNRAARYFSVSTPAAFA